MKILSKNSLIIALATFSFGLVGVSTALAGNPEAVVDLGSAGNFRILAKTAVTTTGVTSVTGDIGISPAAASFITGFSLVADASNKYSTSALVTGKIYAANYAVPTPATMTTAISDMETAYTNAANRITPDDTNRAAGIITGQTFTPGLYKWTTDVTLAGVAGTTTDDVVLSGGANDVWIFQITGDLTAASSGSIADGAHIVLTGGAVASNVFWQVGGLTGATLGTYSTFKGNILTAKQVIMQTGAVLEGRALAQTQVTLDANTVSGPVASGPGSITVIKTVINDSGKNKTISEFALSVGGTSVVSGVTNAFSAPATYIVSEAADPLYIKTFSGDCDSNGSVSINSGDSKICLISNDDIAAGSYTYSNPVATTPIVVPPIIDLVKVPSPLALPAGPGAVTYTYTLRNVGTVPATDITMVGDTCSPIALVSGDTNADAKLDVNETWVYSCSTTLAKTHTNTVTATGWANGVSAVDVASATVIVGVPIVPPLVHITVVPSPLALRAGGGVVTYTKMVTNPGAVALSNVRITDDKCGTIRYILGDTNKDAKLDTSETWVYMCQANLTKNTTNIAQATGEANGLTARDFAITTVLVAAPSFPNTGVNDNKGLTRAEAIAVFHRSLGIGAQGVDVEALQTILETKGLLTMPQGVAKGYFGNLTRKAVEKYQKEMGLPMVGIFGPQTRAKVTSELTD